MRAGLQCLQLCADALCSCDLSPLSALTDLRALALTSHNDKQRYAVPPSVLGAHSAAAFSSYNSGFWHLRALALTSHNDKQRCAVPPSVLGAHCAISMLAGHWALQSACLWRHPYLLPGLEDCA